MILFFRFPSEFSKIRSFAFVHILSGVFKGKIPRILLRYMDLPWKNCWKSIKKGNRNRKSSFFLRRVTLHGGLLKHTLPSISGLSLFSSEWSLYSCFVWLMDDVETKSSKNVSGSSKAFFPGQNFKPKLQENTKQLRHFSARYNICGKEILFMTFSV